MTPPVPYKFPGIVAMPDIRGNQPRWRFDYVNWRDERHSYVVDVEGVEFRPSEEYNGTFWTVHGNCLERDGAPRYATPRRSFLIGRIENLEVK